MPGFVREILTHHSLPGTVVQRQVAYCTEGPSGVPVSGIAVFVSLVSRVCNVSY